MTENTQSGSVQNRRRSLEYPDGSLYDMLRKSSVKYAGGTAIEYYSRKISYEELVREIERCAYAFSALGVEKGEYVSVILPNIPQAVISFYGLNRIGACASMIHPLSAEKEIEHYISMTGSRIVIALDLIADKLKGLAKLGCRIILASAGEYMPFFMKTAYRLTKKKVTFPGGAVDWKSFMSTGKSEKGCEKGASGSAAAVLYSGGTTGKPKGIVLTNLNFNALALESIDACGCLESGDRVLSVMPVFHGFGLGVCIHTVFSFGGTAVMLPQFKAADFHKLVLKYKPNVIAGVPSIYEYMLRSNGFEKKDLSFLKCIISGGDSLSPATKKKLDAVFAAHGCKAEIREGYGLTECVTGTCLMPEKSGKEGSVGLPYADTFYRIADIETGNELPDGEQGEILLRGPAVMKGYLNDEEETAKALRLHEDGSIWLHTGDMGYKDKDGFIYFSQRLKRIIVSNGYNIYPQNIENTINSHRDVLMCAVVGAADEIRGQRVKAYVVPKSGADCGLLKGELEELCRKNIAAYAVPRDYEFRDSLPRTLVGKIAYTELLEEKAVNEK